MADATVTRSCPLCEDRAATVRRTVDGWDLATCDACGFLYAPTIREDTATELELPDDYEPVWRARHRQIHRLLAGLLAEDQTVVDVGAGFGELGLVTAGAGRLTYIGYEPSETVAAAARRRGVDMRAEMFTPTTLADPVGAVVLDNVIEHVADPVRLLSDCAEALAPGGTLVVIVPNRYDVRQVVPRWRKANHWIPPEHINYFTAGSLRRALERLGLTVHPFGFAALDRADWKYWPRAAGERLGLFPFGINVYATRNGDITGRAT
jgi:SAM-dependent methyltransferase